MIETGWDMDKSPIVDNVDNHGTGWGIGYDGWWEQILNIDRKKKKIMWMSIFIGQFL